MPYFTSSAEWYEQSALLLKARPTTARIVTKYSIIKRKESKDRVRKSATSDPAGDASATAPHADKAPAPATPRAALTLKTYDPASGVCLKYQTSKAQEVGRLVASLEKLARSMAALPDVAEDIAMPDAPPTDQNTGTNTPNPDAAKPAPTAGGGGGGGGKKKKKGKK
ncbi:uncharacterized protein K452DRAFT_360948 [Aplosporella prunicola CBS 121167]|uniref:SRP9 domain-containing protein n=1 Tax=Aplosporella prunicola CBS 121167 TaxID=1176127 RepID=A0A6A6B3R8_9PEZI|nr:uncharacterized protein K452DRAFT_360948 [Aplosporella prunicola CBS 121167]KAF2138710.1 hypothetical protein K452DRAFT_360948 [Aplosporella prunicola CBS 121167]